MKNIRSMTFGELIKLKAKIESVIELRVANERRQLMKAIDKLGMTKLQKVGGRPTVRPSSQSNSLKGKKLRPRYRNPMNRKETWAGRGLTPRWLVAALKGGKKLEAFAIK